MLAKLLSISPQEVTFARRSFPDGPLRPRLETICRSFLDAYHAALADPGAAAVMAHVETLPPDLQGFAAEGAGMALALRDALTPRRGHSLADLVGGPGERFTYLVHVGAGWAEARIGPWLGRRPRRQLDRQFVWLADDGHGFHDGYFHTARCHAGWRPRTLRGYALRAYDHGIGRSLWFSTCADPRRIAATIAALPAARRGDLWSGVGLAAAYAGGAEPADLALLADAAGTHRGHLAMGAAFAVETRVKAGAVPAEAVVACRALCDRSIEEMAATVAARRPDADVPEEHFYERWRSGVLQDLSLEDVA